MILKTALETSQMLDLPVTVVVERMDEGEAEVVRQGIGFVLAEIDERLINPVFDEHPRLEPDNTGTAWRELTKRVGARDMRVV